MKKEIKLTAKYFNNSTYVFYGKTKKECKKQLISKFGNSKGFKIKYGK